MSASIDTGLGLPDVGELATLAKDWTKMAIWADDPLTQIAVNAVIIVVMMLSSSVGLLVGIPIAIVALCLASIGVARLLFQLVT